MLISNSPAPAVNADAHDHGERRPDSSDAARGAHTDRLDRVGGWRSLPSRRVNRRVLRPRPPQEMRDDRLQRRAKPAPPIADRLARHSKPLPSPTVPLHARTEQRRADHLRHVPAARQAHIRQQHMRRRARPLPTTAATRRTQPPHPHAPSRTTRQPRSSPNHPTRQPGNAGTPTVRAARSTSTTARSSETMSTTTSNGVAGS